MSDNSNFLDSVIGCVLHGKSTEPTRPKTHIDDRRLKEYNQFFTLLSQGAECSIFRKCNADQKFTQVKMHILSLGMKLFENEGESIIGNSIFCEHNKKIRTFPDTPRNFCVMKGDYAFAWVSKVMKNPGSFYHTTDKMTANEKFAEKEERL